MSNKITKFISRIAGAVSKNEQTREFLTPATSEISRDTKNLLAGLFGKNDQKGENNQDNSKSDIKANHGIINVTHNNLSFVNNKLNPQAEKANSKPKVISFKSVTPLNNGPMDIEAADTVPKSEDISAILNTCESDNLIKSNLMQDNNTASDNNVSTSGVRDAQQCPYCQSKNFVKRGVRKNVNQTVQI